MQKECHCFDSPADEEFSPQQLTHIDEIIDSFRGKPGNLIPVLEEIQDFIGYLPESVQRRVARGLSVPLSQVYGVVTFYSFFTMKPRGKHQIRLCLGTACHVRGSQQLLEELENKLCIDPGECTADRQFSLDVVRCLGACGLAPVVMVDEKTHRQVKARSLNHILEEYRQSPVESKE